MDANQQLIAELGNASPVTVGKWTFHPSTLLLLYGEQTIKLEPRVALLLLCLIEKAGEPVSREALMNRVWGDVVVGDEALTSAIAKLRKALGEDSHHSETIKTIPKIGYQLVAEVGHSATGDEKDYSRAPQKKRTPFWIYLVAGSFVIVTALMIFGHFNQPDQSSTENLVAPPSIAVLPFINMSDDEGQEYFVDGITEDLTTDLSKLSGLRVIARNSLDTINITNIDYQEINNELGITYVIQGSVRRSEEKLRINVKLIDTATGASLWAERYDKEVQGLFGIQDEISSNIVQALKIKLGTNEERRFAVHGTNNFEAYDVFLRGQQVFSSRTKENIAEAISLYRTAIDLDPNYSRAYGAMAVAMTFQYRRGFTKSPLETIDRALELGERAVNLNNNIPQAYWALGYVHLFRKEFDEAIEAIKTAVEISPSYADAYGLLALIYNSQGNAKAAMESIYKAIELNPYYSYDYPYNLGRAQYLMGRYEEAVENLTEALDKNETAPTPRIYLIASYVRLGSLDDAEWEVDQLQIQTPSISISQLRRISPVREQLLDDLIDDLRQAGFPE